MKIPPILFLLGFATVNTEMLETEVLPTSKFADI